MMTLTESLKGDNKETKQKVGFYKKITESRKLQKDFYVFLTESIEIRKKKNKEDKNFYVFEFKNVTPKNKRYLANFYTMLVEKEIPFKKDGTKHKFYLSERSYNSLMI